MNVPFDLGPGAAIWMIAATLVASFVRGYSGFGYSAMVIAAGSLVTNPLHLVPAVVLLEFAMSVQAWKGAGPDVDWNRTLWLLAGAAIGLPLGLWALTSVPEDGARAAISVYVLAMCIVLLLGWRLSSEVAGSGNGLAGIVSGIANAPGMGGLPVAAFFAAQPMSPAIFRATLIAYFPLLDLGSGPLYWWHGMITADTLMASVWLMPVTALGNWLGSRHFFGTDPQDFRRFSIILLAALAGLGLAKALL